MAQGNQQTDNFKEQVELLLDAPEKFPESGISRLKLPGIRNAVFWENDNGFIFLGTMDAAETMLLQSNTRMDEQLNKIKDYIFRITGPMVKVSEHVTDMPGMNEMLHPHNIVELTKSVLLQQELGMTLPSREDRMELLGHIAGGLGRISIIASNEINDDVDEDK